MSNGRDDFGWGVIINFEKSKKSKSIDLERDEEFIVDMLVNVTTESMMEKSRLVSHGLQY